MYALCLICTTHLCCTASSVEADMLSIAAHSVIIIRVIETMRQLCQFRGASVATVCTCVQSIVNEKLW